jgi:hypothetical protein
LIGLVLAAALDAAGVPMATELLDVARSRCGLSADAAVAAKLDADLHQFDIGGIASAVGPQLDLFYEEFAADADADLARFCAAAPGMAARAGYPGLFRVR